MTYDEIDELDTIDQMIEDEYYEDVMTDAFILAELDADEGWPYDDYSD